MRYAICTLGSEELLYCPIHASLLPQPDPLTGKKQTVQTEIFSAGFDLWFWFGF